MVKRLSLFGGLFVLAACASPDDGAPVTGDEADLTATLGSFRLSLNVLAPQGGSARIHGLAHQPIEAARAFIPDDEVGTTIVAPKTFTTSFRAYEVNLFLNGRPAFFSVSTPTEAYVARADLGVKVTTDSTLGLKVTSTAASVLVNGVSLVRLKGSFNQPLTAVKTTINGADVAGLVSGKNWQIDCPIPFIGDAIANDRQIPITLTTAQGQVADEVEASFKMKAIELAQGDAYELWPTPTCTPEVLACIQKPGNTADTAACGDALHVQPCWKQLHP